MATDRKGRLPKVTQACDTCRTRKTKCDGASPCANCVHHGFSCAFNVSQNGPAPKKRKRLERAIGESSSSVQPVHYPHTPVSSVSSIPSSTAPDPRRPSQTDLYPGNAAIEHDLVKSLDDIRVHAENREFHGPSGILSFLSKLRSKAQQARPQVPTPNDDEPTGIQSDRGRAPFASTASPHGSIGVVPLNPQAISPELARACVRQYLQNLHLIHPFIEQSMFIPHSERILGNRRPHEIPLNHPERHFIALYYALAAVGALTATADSLPLDRPPPGHTESALSTHRSLAEALFLLAKNFLGDIFESTSFDSVSVLVILAVYCQNALRPNACYQYSGMAVRSALAIGLPASAGQSTSEIRRCLWWSLYSHELEVCSSVGRSSSLLEARSYTIGFPGAGFDNPASIIEPMVAFAAVVGDASKQLYQTGAEANLQDRSRTTMTLNHRLDEWRASLPPALHPDITNLQAPEWRLKQKVVLNLRFHNARILLHRPFLSALGSRQIEPYVFEHIRICVESSQSTINILHSAYLNRPYFRTWWYNTSYVLYATMVILYILLSGLSEFSDDNLLESVRQGLDVLESMKTDVVASRCAEIVREVLSIVTQLVKERSSRAHQRSIQPHYTLPSPEMDLPLPSELTSSINMSTIPANTIENWTFDGDLFNHLVDPGFIDSLLQADMWSGFQGAI